MPRLSRKRIDRRNKIAIGVILILVIIGLLLVVGRYDGLIKTQVTLHSNDLPDICYNKTTANVSYVCSVPTLASVFVGSITSNIGNAENKDITSAIGIDDEGTYKMVAQYSAVCTGYCNCAVSTDPTRPSSCPADSTHDFSPKPAPVCQYTFRGKVKDNSTTITLRNYLGNGSFRYTYEDINGVRHEVVVPSVDAFHRDSNLTRYAQQQCTYEARYAVNHSNSADCSAVCSRYLPAGLTGIRETGSCTTKTLKNPLPAACVSPTPTTTPTHTPSPSPTRTPSPTPRPTVTPTRTAVPLGL